MLPIKAPPKPAAPNPPVKPIIANPSNTLPTSPLPLITGVTTKSCEPNGKNKSDNSKSMSTC